jgi:hypothetical protein
VSWAIPPRGTSGTGQSSVRVRPCRPGMAPANQGQRNGCRSRPCPSGSNGAPSWIPWPPSSASTTRGCANASASAGASTGARCPVLCGCDLPPPLPARHRVPAKDSSSVKGVRGGAPRPTNVVGTSGTSRHGPVGVTAPKRKCWVGLQASPVSLVLEKEFSRATPLTEAGVGRGLDG